MLKALMVVVNGLVITAGVAGFVWTVAMAIVENEPPPMLAWVVLILFGAANIFALSPRTTSFGIRTAVRIGNYFVLVPACLLLAVGVASGETGWWKFLLLFMIGAAAVGNVVSMREAKYVQNLARSDEHANEEPP